MPSRLPSESPAKVRQRVEHFFDVVARLLAKRWLREQRTENQPDSEQDDDGGADPAPLKS